MRRKLDSLSGRRYRSRGLRIGITRQRRIGDLTERMRDASQLGGSASPDLPDPLARSAAQGVTRPQFQSDPASATWRHVSCFAIRHERDMDMPPRSLMALRLHSPVRNIAGGRTGRAGP